ncbi:hypothetical protein AAGS61_01840 [Lysinibacillus sp. KU-BSD001]|uniref:hypothetical protein n=1 Tax=Lysinibacillus sp. KU-BSD001 TaxID=3141328 RepID=UPI0036E39045
MTDKQKAMEAITNFLNDTDKRILLIKGYDSEAKLKVTLSCLNQVFKLGIIRTGSMSDMSRHINRAFNEDLLPNSIKSTAIYKLGKMSVNFSSYVNHTQNNPEGNEDTFTLFYPVESVLKNLKRYKNFLDEIKRTQSRKIILVTTNEWSIKEWDIENHIDETFFYSVENDNPQIMTNLKNNGAI